MATPCPHIPTQTPHRRIPSPHILYPQLPPQTTQHPPPLLPHTDPQLPPQPPQPPPFISRPHIHRHVPVNLRGSFKTGSHHEMIVAHRNGSESPGRRGQQFLSRFQTSRRAEAIKATGGEVVSHHDVTMGGDGERLENQGASRWELLNLAEHGAFPAHHLGGRGGGSLWVSMEAL